MPQGVRFTGAYEVSALPALIPGSWLVCMQKVPSAFRHLTEPTGTALWRYPGPRRSTTCPELQHARRIFRD
jgi:hypothetical protein